MIARCPHCQTRYRIAREKLGEAGARLRCRRCRTVFQVTPPSPEAIKPAIQSLERVEPTSAHASGAPSGRAQGPREPGSGSETAVVADSDPALAEGSRKLLEAFGIHTLSIDHGPDALLQIVRRPPTLVVLGGHLTGISAPTVAELIRRNPALASVRIIRIAPIDEPAGVPEFDADVTLEPARATQGLPEALRKLGIGTPPAAPSEPPAPAPTVDPAPAPSLERPAPEPHEPPAASRGPAPSSPPAADPAPRPDPAPSPTVASQGAPVAESSAAPSPELAAAERLARIAVSDIVLYNEDKFRKAVEANSIPDSFGAELDEARQMFCKRIPESIRRQRDFLTEELVRRAEKLARAS